MKEGFVNEILMEMMDVIDGVQLVRLREILLSCLRQYDVRCVDSNRMDEKDYVDSFISAKKIEGCSDKTIVYYKNTIEKMIKSVGKSVLHINTDDLRAYLTEYRELHSLSKVTIDNIRRIMSSFFSWLEDEDYIIKSPVRRIHKVKMSILGLDEPPVRRRVSHHSAYGEPSFR